MESLTEIKSQLKTAHHDTFIPKSLSSPCIHTYKGQKILGTDDLLLTEHNDVRSKMALKVILSGIPGNVQLEEPEQSLIT